MQYIIKLASVSRKQSEINQEMIQQLQQEIHELKQQIMPIGSIIIWSGSDDQIPAGWLLCNGHQGTPDLSDKFVSAVNIEYKYNDEIKYDDHFDANGIIYALGSNFGKSDWLNPVEMKVVDVTASTIKSDTAGKHSFIGRVAGVRCATENKKNSWFCVDFKMFKVRPTRYTLRHYTSHDNYALRKWRLEGSKDKVEWICIKEHVDDDSLNEKDKTQTWDIPDCNEYFKYFRVYMTGKNSGNTWSLNCSGFEIFGRLVRDPLYYIMRNW